MKLGVKISSLRDQKRFSKIVVICLSAMFSVNACTSTVYDESRDTITIHAGMGGAARSIIERYRRFNASGKQVRIDGHVVSADAFGAFAVDGACYTRNAKFSPHAASYLGVVPNMAATDYLASLLPDKLETWFRSQSAYYDWVGFPVLGYEELRTIWPEGECDSEAT